MLSTPDPAYGNNSSKVNNVNTTTNVDDDDKPRMLFNVLKDKPYQVYRDYVNGSGSRKSVGIGKRCGGGGGNRGVNGSDICGKKHMVRKQSRSWSRLMVMLEYR